MRQARLWPLIVALAVLLGAASALEIASRSHEAEVEVIAITRNQEALEEGAEDEQRWYAQAPISDDHRRARALAMRGDYDGALTLFARLETEHAQTPLLLAEHGHFLRKSGDVEAALRLLDQARTALPDNATVALDRATALTQLGRTTEASQAYEEALAARPNHTLTRVAYGTMLRREKKLAHAIAILTPASEYGGNEERARALVELGRALMEAGQHKAARKALTQAVQRAPASPTIWAKAARAHLYSAEKEDRLHGLALAEKAQALLPDVPEAHSLLARARELNGLPLEALAAYNRVLQLDPSYQYARKRALRLTLDQEDIRAARKHAEALLRAAPKQRESYFLAGLVELRGDDLPKARTLYARAIEASTQPYPEALYNLGLLERRLEHLPEAERAYREALSARPGYGAALHSLGLVLQDMGRLPEAEQALRRAVTQNSSRASSWLALGKCLEEQGRRDDAIEAVKKAIEASSDYLPARLQLGIVYRRAQRYDDAIAAYQSIIREHPRYVRAWYNLGVAYAAAGRTAKARDAYGHALAHDPNHRRALKNLGLLEAKEGSSEQARTLLEDALSRDPSDDEVRGKLAELHFLQGALPQCRHEASLVLTHRPDDSLARDLLGRCQANQLKD